MSETSDISGWNLSVEDVEARMQEKNEEFEKEKNKLVCALLASSDEIRRHKKASRNKARKARRARNALLEEKDYYEALVENLERGKDEVRTSYNMRIEKLKERMQEKNKEFEKEKSKLVCALLASSDEIRRHKKASRNKARKARRARNALLEDKGYKEMLIEELGRDLEEVKISYERKIEDLEARMRDSNSEFEKEKSKLICALLASSEEKKRHKKATRNKARKARRARKALLEDKVYNDMLIRELEHELEEVKETYKTNYKNLAARYDEVFVENSKLIKKLEASRDEVEKSNEALEKLKSALCEEKKQNCELELKMKEDKRKLAEELEASRGEAEKSNKATEKLKSALCKAVTVAMEEKKRICEVELKMKEEKSKLVEELEASRVEAEKSKKATEELKLALCKVAVANEEMKQKYCELELEKKEIENSMLEEEKGASRDEVAEKRNKALEELEASRDEVAEESNEALEKQEKMHSGDDWELVEEEDEQN